MGGGSDGDVTFCGDVFEKNHGRTLRGVLFPVCDAASHNVNFQTSTADSNTVRGPLGDAYARAVSSGVGGADRDRGCPPTDQNGKARGNPCTIGAVEE